MDTSATVRRLGAALNAWRDEITNFPMFWQTHEELFHYTGVHGLKGIVESNSLWATSAYHLNDSSEIEYGCDLIKEALAEWITLNPDNKSVAMFILKHLRDHLSHPLSMVVRELGFFVTCFCEKGNLLSQWRAYGQEGAYSIGMLPDALEKLRAPDGFETQLMKVNYNLESQIKSIHSILKRFVVIVERYGDDTLPADIETSKNLLFFLQAVLMDEIVAFKNPAFAEENEWRIVAKRSIYRFGNETNAADVEPKQQKKDDRTSIIRYRAQKGILVPYMELFPAESEKLPIRSVRLGPSLSKTEASLNSFLWNNGHRILVVGSDTPVIL